MGQQYCIELKLRIESKLNGRRLEDGGFVNRLKPTKD
jgi:hypothetical protein